MLHMQDKHSESFLVRLYYQKRIFMGFCCVSCEVLYLMVRTLACTCQWHESAFHKKRLLFHLSYGVLGICNRLKEPSEHIALIENMHTC